MWTDAVASRAGRGCSPDFISVAWRRIRPSVHGAEFPGGPEANGGNAEAEKQSDDCYCDHDTLASFPAAKTAIHIAPIKNTPEMATVQRMSRRVNIFAPKWISVSRTGNTKVSTAASRKNCSQRPMIRIRALRCVLMIRVYHTVVSVLPAANSVRGLATRDRVSLTG
jgi:hypothetical protein